MNKEEFIKQEWLKFIGIQVYNSLKLSNELSDDGWLEVNYLPFDHEKKYDVLKFNKTRFAIRPKSLSGIDKNNGWVKINLDDDLPKESSAYWIMRNNDTISTLNDYETDKKYMFPELKATHYQRIIKPNKPIY